ncbi:MAG: ROK family protein [Pseudomonadota bacterium]
MRIGLDLGGTKIEAVALDGSGSCRFQKRVASPRHDYRATVEALAGLVEEAEASLGVSARVGVGIPGAISPASGLIKNANSTWLIGQALDRDLSARLNRPVRLENDANCFAVSEASDGAAAGFGLVFGVILGTGVGGGLAIDGKAWRGRHAIAGEWGHNPLPWPRPEELPGPACYCGKQGCIETWLSGPGFAADHARQGGDPALTGPDIVAAAMSGEPSAQASLDRYIDRLARALASVINILDPDAIVLGGGLSGIAQIYERLPEQLQAWVFSDRCDTPVLPAKHGDASGVRGAAWLWPPD